MTPAANAPPALALGAGASVLCFAVALLVLHIARRDLAPASHYVSEYARGRLGWLLTSSFLVLGTGSLLLCAALLDARRPGPAAAIVAPPLAAWGIAIAGAGVFRTQPRGAPRDRSAIAHQRAAGVAFGAILLAMWMLVVAARADAWGALRWPALVAAVAATTSYLALRRAAGSAPNRAGAAQRLYLACVVGWLLLLAGHAWIGATG